MENKKEFIALVERYETITLSEIQEEWEINDDKKDVSTALTGFGRSETCTLCLAIAKDCKKCVYGEVVSTIGYGCISGDNYYTYHNIWSARSPINLLSSFRKRAAYMRKKYKHIFENEL